MSCTLIHTDMRNLASLVKGYTLGTVFVLMHVATHELRSRRLPD